MAGFAKWRKPPGLDALRLLWGASGLKIAIGAPFRWIYVSDLLRGCPQGSPTECGKHLSGAWSSDASEGPEVPRGRTRNVDASLK